MEPHSLNEDVTTVLNLLKNNCFFHQIFPQIITGTVEVGNFEQTFNFKKDLIFYAKGHTKKNTSGSKSKAQRFVTASRIFFYTYSTISLQICFRHSNVFLSLMDLNLVFFVFFVLHGNILISVQKPQRFGGAGAIK
jgi:hypothetical protein